MLAIVGQEAHDDPLYPLFKVQKQAAAGLNNNVTFLYSGILNNKSMGKGGKCSRYVSYQAFCTQVEVIGIRNEYCSSIHDRIQGT